MRKIELKDGDGLNYAELLKTILASPPADGRGLRLPEIREALKVMDKIDAAQGSVLLEDDEWRFVRDRVESAPYSAADKRILAFADAVLNAPNVEVTEAA